MAATPRGLWSSCLSMAWLVHSPESLARVENTCRMPCTVCCISSLIRSSILLTVLRCMGASSRPYGVGNIQLVPNPRCSSRIVSSGCVIGRLCGAPIFMRSLGMTHLRAPQSISSQRPWTISWRLPAVYTNAHHALRTVRVPHGEASIRRNSCPNSRGDR